MGREEAYILRWIRVWKGEGEVDPGGFHQDSLPSFLSGSSPFPSPMYLPLYFSVT